MKTTLKQLREENKKSRAEVAAALEVTVSALGNYEQGSRRIDIEQVLVLSELFMVTAEEIIYAQLSSCQNAQVNNLK
ncbi:MAG: helix-turn-helix domain-containing protein [Clostridia bacterium]|nr:helix-turn-helix domain-containing protein [Clostridia bacterium]